MITLIGNLGSFQSKYLQNIYQTLHVSLGRLFKYLSVGVFYDFIFENSRKNNTQIEQDAADNT